MLMDSLSSCVSFKIIHQSLGSLEGLGVSFPLCIVLVLE